MRIWRTILPTIAALAFAVPVSGHMPYVLPTLFDAGGRDRVTIEAAFSEDPFRPEIAMRDAPFEITGPDGVTTKLSGALFTRDRAVIEAALPGDGLYRLSSGQRLGRMNKMYRRGQQWVVVSDGDTPPPGAALIDVRSTTLADAYVLRGKAGASGALKPRGVALEIIPVGDPSAYTAGSQIGFTILFDGKPLDDTDVTVFRENGFYDGRKQVAEVRSGKKGDISATAPDAGRYLVMVRHRPDAPSAGGQHLSYTATLAFEVM